jgi:hypothetical protein
MTAFVLPPPAERVPIDLYRELRAFMLETDTDAPDLLQWSSGVARPADAESLAGEIIWIILCAGRSAQAARTIQARVNKALAENRPVVEVFGYRAKAAAIERAWREREPDFKNFSSIDSADTAAQLRWARGIPFVGSITCYQLLKNCAQDVCKPDIWLCRLAGIADRNRLSAAKRFDACMALCRPLANGTGDRIAAVDSLLWLACNKGILQVDVLGGPVTFVPKTSTARSIYGVAA